MSDVSAQLLEKALETGKALAPPVVEDGIYPYAVVPQGYRIERLSQTRDRPERLEESVTVFDPKSFTHYFTGYSNKNSRIFVDTQRLAIVGVIDYHEQSGEDTEPKPHWLKHRIVYSFRKTVEWTTWETSNKKSMNQVDFGRFLEDNLPDITRPDASSLLQTALTMEAKKKANFSSAVRLDNGETQFTFEEEIRGTASKGSLEIPRDFDLAIAPFEGSPPYKVTARLRYRIDDGALSIWYELVRPHKVIEDAVNQVVETVRQGVSNPITFGSIGPARS